MEDLEARDKIRGILPMTDEELEELLILKKEISKKNSNYDKVQNKFRIYSKYLQANLPRIYWDIGFDNFKGDKVVLKTIKRYIENMKEALSIGQGLILYGTYGTGKTSIACIIAKEAIKKGYSVKFISMSKILDMINDSFSGKIERDRLDTIIERTELLILDDLGKEYIGVRKQLAPMVNLKLDSLFRERINKNNATIVTTNLGANNIKNNYGDSVWSVLNGACKPYKVEGLDFRTVKDYKFWEKINE